MIVGIPIDKYSFSELARIVESNNSKFYGAFILDFKDEKVEVLIKISGRDLSSIGAAFERFGYEIIHKFYEDDKQDLMEERYSQLMKFIDI